SGSRAFFPRLSHKDIDKYPQTKMTIVVTELAQNPIYCLLFWERLVRFMDNTKPLPEITKPWLRWTPEPERKQTLNWKYKAKRLFMQLTCGIP
ncbi:hypothetical protein HHE92_11455, partial [Pseudoalteromonas arctica]|nr:hypothetical protein [Pseudoalteromonas arctica]